MTIAHEHRQDQPTAIPVTSIDEAAVILALSYPETPYFITTTLYWDCECPKNYIRPAGMLMCENCGAHREDQPDSRINEARRHGIHLDWAAPPIAQTLQEHGQHTALNPVSR